MSKASDSSADRPEKTTVEVPVAIRRRYKRSYLAWIIPSGALILAVYLSLQWLSSRGPELLIVFDHSHRISENDRVTHRGVDIGIVTGSSFNPDSGKIDVRVRLKPEAASFAREGAKAWIVKPELSLSKVSGLDTIVGASYLEMLPGDGDPVFRMEGLSAAPLVQGRLQEGLTLNLRLMHAGSVRPGSPVMYKGLNAGLVLEHSLQPDGGGVHVKVIIAPEFSRLVRENSVFWNSGGLDMQVGLRGIGIQAESLESVLTGSISFATPPVARAGSPVATDHWFDLSEDVDDDWREWNPGIAPE